MQQQAKKLSLGKHLDQDEDILPLIQRLFSDACKMISKSADVHRKNARTLMSMLKAHLRKRPQDFEKIRRWIGPSSFRIAKWKNFRSLLYWSMWRTDDEALENKLVGILKEDLKAHSQPACPLQRQKTLTIPSRKSSSISRNASISRKSSSSASRKLPEELSPPPQQRKLTITEPSRKSSSHPPPAWLPQELYSGQSSERPAQRPLQRKLTITEPSSAHEWWQQEGSSPLATTTTTTTAQSRPSMQRRHSSRKKADQLFSEFLNKDALELITKKPAQRRASSKRRSSSYPSAQQLSLYM